VQSAEKKCSVLCVLNSELKKYAVRELKPAGGKVAGRGETGGKGDKTPKLQLT